MRIELAWKIRLTRSRRRGNKMKSLAFGYGLNGATRLSFGASCQSGCEHVISLRVDDTIRIRIEH